MKLVRYGQPGREKPGALDAQGVLRDLSGEVDDIAGDVLLPASIAKLKALDLSSLPAVEGSPRIGACVGRVGKFIGVGLNYTDHAEETGAEAPAEPVMFMKTTSSICGPNDNIRIPRGSEKTDWEVELGIVIGQDGKYIPRDTALDHVAGYCTICDVTERSYQFERGPTWDKGKGCDTFGPIGPWLVTPDEIKDPHSLPLWLEVDGERMQFGSTEFMIFKVAELISYISHFWSLQPGDVIATGTPAGVGMGHKPPRFLRPGNRITLGVEKLGEQSHHVVADD